MAYIKTILPTDITAYIEVDDTFIDNMVTALLDVIILIENDHYILNPELSGNVNMIDSRVDATVISHTFLSNVLIKKFPLELMMWYQQDRSKGINEPLLHYITKQLHKEPLFAAAKSQTKLPQSDDLLEEVIEWDDPSDFDVAVQQSVVATNDIIDNMMHNM